MTKICPPLIAILAATAGCAPKTKGELRQHAATEESARRTTSVAGPDRPAEDGKDEPGAGAVSAHAAAPMIVTPKAPAAVRQEAADYARNAGVLGSTVDSETGAFKAVAGTGDLSSGFDGAAGGGGKGSGTSNRRGGGGGEVATRAWFPETFLFEPLVVTDEHGEATVPVRVPDRLTTWRVLALAHSRTGAQGGTVTSFAGTLAAYVEPIAPKTLVVGDVVRIPIQLVNTTSTALTETLSVEARGGKLVASGGSRTIPAEGSLVEYATLSVTRAGPVTLVVKLGDTDAVVRTIDVVPAGRAVRTARSGTLAAPRTLTTEATPGADPETDHVRLLAFPGALSLLRSELGVSTARAGVADDAYALLLAGRAPALLAALGDKADPVALRELTILTSQRVIRDGRTLDVATASLLAEAALAHPQNPVLARLGERAVAFLQQKQRPDGTFDPATPASAGALQPGGGGTGWTLQRLLVVTADATRATAARTDTAEQRQRAEAIAVRASAAFERNLDRVDDPYTAAAILASGAASGAVADRLRAKVRAGITDAPEATGAKILAVGDGVVRGDGARPNLAEATAMGVLALVGSQDAGDKAALADLGATLLGSYSPERGWGDGRANLACMRAVLELFKAPVPADVKITLAMDGVPIVTGTLSRERLRDVLVLEVPAAGLASAHTWTVAADPPVPGLGYALALESWVPWDKAAVHGGLELALPPTVAGEVGKPTDLAIAAIAPSSVPLHITEALPAGVQVDTPTLDGLVTAGTIERYEVADGKVDLYVAGLAPGQTFAVKLRVIPTLAGTLHAPASALAAAGAETHVPPTTWTIK